MKNILNKKINNTTIADLAVYIYLWLFFVYTTIGRIAPLSKLLEGTINSIIFILFALSGAVLVIIDFLSTKHMFKPKYTFWLILFILVMFISSLLNRNYGIVDNIKTLVWTTIHFLLLYPLFQRGNSKQHHLFLRRLMQTFLCIFSIAVAISIIQYVFQYGYTIEIEGRIIRQGFIDHRLFGVFKDPNFAASTSLIGFIGGIYLLNSTQKLWLKNGYLMVMLINFIYIVLSGSRSVLLAYVVCVMILFYLFVRRFTMIHYDFADSVSYSVVSLILAVMLSLSSYYGTKMICEQIPVVLGTSQNATVLEREDVDVSNISNNRFDIWKDYIDSTLDKDKMLFGLSPRNATIYIQENHPESYVGKTGYETHCAYISLFSGVGFIGTAIMGIFIFLSIKNVINHVFIYKDYNVWFILSLAIVGGLAVYSVFLTDLFFVNNLTTIIFWPLLGYLNTYQPRWMKALNV